MANLVVQNNNQAVIVKLGLFSFQSGYDTDWHLLAAASFIALVPVITVFVLLHRVLEKRNPPSGPLLWLTGRGAGARPCRAGRSSVDGPAVR